MIGSKKNNRNAKNISYNGSIAPRKPKKPKNPQYQLNLGFIKNIE